MIAETNLRKILAHGEFAVTCEVTPPRGTDLDRINKIADSLKGKVDAVNVNDGPNSNVRMSSLALSKILLDRGIEPVLEMAGRDRNRIALQADLLGASAFGIQNILCLTGDHPSAGDHPQANKVFDIDSSQWIAAVRQIRDQGCLMNGKKISGSPQFFIGAVANPFVDNIDLHIIRLKNKIAAGAEFIQTQPVFDPEHFRQWMDQVNKQKLSGKAPVIAGVVALKSAEMAKYLNEKVSGITVPATVIDRLDSVSADKQQEEGINICIEQIKVLQETDGVKGVHIMAVGWEETLAEIIERAGLVPRPQV